MHDRTFEKEHTQIYSRRVTHVHVMKRHPANIVVTVGDGIDPRPFEEQEESRLAASTAVEKVRREKVAAGGDPGAEYPLLVASTGADGASSLPVAVVKVWRLESKEGSSPTPVCIRSFRVFDVKSSEVADECAVTCLAVTEDLAQIAVGLMDGSVFLFRGEFHRERGSTKREIVQVRTHHHACAYTERLCFISPSGCVSSSTDNSFL